jgi:hypothetical protein
MLWHRPLRTWATAMASAHQLQTTRKEVFTATEADNVIDS